jgi:predicted O-linked N-acetylglucosamine transferase (SPINDLY family)
MNNHPLLVQAEQAFKAGQLQAAETAVRKLLAEQPDHLPALRLLASILHQQRRLPEAADTLQRYLKIAPDDSPIVNSLGVFLAEEGKTAAALAEFERAAQMNPALAEAHNNQGIALERLGRLDDSAAAFTKAVAIRPAYAEAQANLGRVLRHQNKQEQAIRELQQAIDLDARHAPAYHTLAGTLEDLGRPEAGYIWRRRLVEMLPGDPVLHSDLLWSTLCVPDVPPEQRLAEHLEWGRRHAEPLARNVRPHANDRTPDRRLRVGYVSPNFGAQAIGWFMAPLLAAHERQQVEVYCYSDIAYPDWMTKKIHGLADQWRETTRLSHHDLAELVRRDKIDLLIDVRGHMAGHRLVAFAEKPAPVQMSYIGYQYTTGVKAIDYRICDHGTDPPGLTEKWHVEKLVRLPHSIWCYQPQEQSQPAAAPLEKNGFVTFGIFQKPAKLNGFVVEMWARILGRAPMAKLAVLCPGPQTLEHLRRQFQARQIDPERIRPLYKAPRQGYLELFAQADVAVDSFPYAGVTTTCDAMWMGAPVLTLLGPEPFERAGASLMPPCGLSTLMASHPLNYIELAVRLGNNPSPLASLRYDLRERMRSSELMDGQSLARAIEVCFREAWMQWVADCGR